MSGPLGDMGNILKQAQAMQRELDRAREELSQATVEGSSGGGAVKVVVDGDGQLRSIEISPRILDSGDHAMIEDLVLTAVRDGISRAQDLRKERLSKVTGGLQLPGLF